MIKENPNTKLYVAIGFIALVLGVMLLYFSWPLISGKSMMLATEPIDPFDPLRGQYIVINYEISTLQNIPFDASKIKEGDAVYVSLKEDSTGIWRYQSLSKDIPKNSDFIKGTAKNSGQSLRVMYGIEQYFFERGAQFSTQNITVKVKVASDGNARVVGLYKDGKPLEITYKKSDIINS